MKLALVLMLLGSMARAEGLRQVGSSAGGGNIAGNTFTVGTSSFAVSGGKVGIGTSSPSDLLDVNGSETVRGQETVVSSFTTYGILRSQGDANNTSTGGLLDLRNTNQSSYWRLGESNNSGLFDFARIGGFTVPNSPLTLWIDDTHTNTSIGGCATGVKQGLTAATICPAKSEDAMTVYDLSGNRELSISGTGAMTSVSSVTFSSATAFQVMTQAKALCINATGQLSVCTTVVGATGGCTCQ